MLDCESMKSKVLILTHHELLDAHKAVAVSDMRFKHFCVDRCKIEDSDIVLFLGALGKATVLKDRFRSCDDRETKESSSVQKDSYIIVPRGDASHHANVLKVAAVDGNYVTAVHAYNKFEVFFFEMSELQEIGYVAFEAGSETALATLATE